MWRASHQAWLWSRWMACFTSPVSHLEKININRQNVAKRWIREMKAPEWGWSLLRWNCCGNLLGWKAGHISKMGWDVCLPSPGGMINLNPDPNPNPNPNILYILTVDAIHLFGSETVDSFPPNYWPAVSTGKERTNAAHLSSPTVGGYVRGWLRGKISASRPGWKKAQITWRIIARAETEIGSESR